jgi:hypothetical protein
MKGEIERRRERVSPKHPEVQLNVVKWQIPSLLTDFETVNSHTLKRKTNIV